MSVLVLRLHRGSTVRLHRRTTLACLGLLLLALGTAFAALCHGDGWSPPGEVLTALSGSGPLAVPVTEWRLPRVAAAVVFGVALGLAGAIFQNLTRNPLGTPDIIGLDAGAYTGVLVVLTLSATVSTIGIGVPAGALVGGLLAATLIYLLSSGHGFSGLRLIVIGIAVNAVLTAVNSLIVLRAELELAIAATVWSAGSLNGLDPEDVGPQLIVIGVASLLLLLLARPMHQMALGDDVGMASGVGITRLRVLLVLIGVILTATVTSAAGPIVFVALAAPQIGRRLAGAAGIPLLPAALTGAVVLTGSDLLAQALLPGTILPVGVVTTAVGGVYLLWLLLKEVR